MIETVSLTISSKDMYFIYIDMYTVDNVILLFSWIILDTSLDHFWQSVCPTILCHRNESFELRRGLANTSLSLSHWLTDSFFISFSHLLNEPKVFDWTSCLTIGYTVHSSGNEIIAHRDEGHLSLISEYPGSSLLFPTSSGYFNVECTRRCLQLKC